MKIWIPTHNCSPIFLVFLGFHPFQPTLTSCYISYILCIKLTDWEGKNILILKKLIDFCKKKAEKPEETDRDRQRASICQLPCSRSLMRRRHGGFLSAGYETLTEPRPASEQSLHGCKVVLIHWWQRKVSESCIWHIILSFTDPSFIIIKITTRASHTTYTPVIYHLDYGRQRLSVTRTR